MDNRWSSDDGFTEWHLVNAQLHSNRSSALTDCPDGRSIGRWSMATVAFCRAYLPGITWPYPASPLIPIAVSNLLSISLKWLKSNRAPSLEFGPFSQIIVTFEFFQSIIEFDSCRARLPFDCSGFQERCLSVVIGFVSRNRGWALELRASKCVYLKICNW